jgi:hypothetical protein
MAGVARRRRWRSRSPVSLRGRGGASEGQAGSVDRPRPEPVGLAEPRGPDGSAGRLG